MNRPMAGLHLWALVWAAREGTWEVSSLKFSQPEPSWSPPPSVGFTFSVLVILWMTPYWSKITECSDGDASLFSPETPNWLSIDAIFMKKGRSRESVKKNDANAALSPVLPVSILFPFIQTFTGFYALLWNGGIIFTVLMCIRLHSTCERRVCDVELEYLQCLQQHTDDSHAWWAR